MSKLVAQVTLALALLVGGAVAGLGGGCGSRGGAGGQTPDDTVGSGSASGSAVCVGPAGMPRRYWDSDPDYVRCLERASGDGPSPSTTPTRAECEALLEHTLAVGLAEQRAAVTAELVPTDADVAAIRAELGPQMIADCLPSPREVLTCSLAAATVAAMAECSLAPAAPES